MTIMKNLQLLARAAVFATVAIGSLAAGLSITTYTVAKANDMVFSSAERAPVVRELEKMYCS